MKKVLLSAVVLVAAAGAATAADLPSYNRAPPAPFVAASNWTGCYIGGHVGGGWSWTRFRNTANGDPATFDFVVGDGFDNPGAGFVGGGQAGCNYQMGRLVYGIEGTYTAANIKGSYDTSAFSATPDFFAHKLTDIATVAGRFGMAFDQWHFYTRLGWAVARNTVSFVDPAAGVSASDAHWHNGFVIGSGTEYAITRNWIAGFESNYYRFESKSYELGGGVALNTFNVRPRDVWTAVGRLSYKF